MDENNSTITVDNALKQKKIQVEKHAQNALFSVS